MSTVRKGLSLVAIAAVGALALSACNGTVGGGSSSSGSAAPAGDIADTISFGMPQAPFGYNPNSTEGNSVYNQWIDNATQSGFTYMDPEGEMVANKDFGTYKKTSDDPLTIEYTFSDDAIWSDDTAIDCDDFVWQWASKSGKVADGVDPDSGLPKNIFDSASTNGWADMKMPECKAGDKKVTVEYEQFYVDWETMGLEVFMPGHILEEQGGLKADDDGAEAITTIKDAAGGDAAAVAKLKPAADFWSTSWNYPEGQITLDAAALKLMPASGPYVYVSGENNVVTVKKNDKWWGEKAKTENLVFKVIAQDELPQALSNHEIDAFQPSSVTVDTVTTLEGMKDKGIETLIGPAMIFAHVDLAQAPGMVFEDQRVREAFLKCIPRQDIVDTLVKPIDPKATIDNLHEYQPFQPDYATVLKGAPAASKYDTVDIEGAKALLAEAGKSSVDVKFLRPLQNPVREQIFQIIQQSCGQVGFNLIDNPQEKWSSFLTDAGNSWDAVVFGWSGSGTVAAGESIYITDGDQNYGKYSDPKVDELWKQIKSEEDADKIVGLKTDMEEQLWVNPYNAVLYAESVLTAYDDTVSGIVSNPTQYGPTWNITTWTKAE